MALCACSAVVCVPSTGRNKRQGQQQVLDIPLDELALTRQGEGQHTPFRNNVQKQGLGQGSVSQLKAVQMQGNRKSKRRMQCHYKYVHLYDIYY